MFKNRSEAGKQLAQKLLKLNLKNPLVLSLPRGGVEVGYEVARILGCPMTVVVVRKVGAPGNPEFAIGAISENDTAIFDENSIKALNISNQILNELLKIQILELARRVKLFRKSQSLPDLKDKTVIIVDDGLATGLTARAAIGCVKKLYPAKIILAVPVASQETATNIRQEVEEFVCLQLPPLLSAVGEFYEDFNQTTDSEVVQILEKLQK